jgi:hypothetical protein
LVLDESGAEVAAGEGAPDVAVGGGRGSAPQPGANAATAARSATVTSERARVIRRSPEGAIWWVMPTALARAIGVAIHPE